METKGIFKPILKKICNYFGNAIWGFQWRLAFVCALQLLFEAVFDRATNISDSVNFLDSLRADVSWLLPDSTRSHFFEFSRFTGRWLAPKYRPCGFETLSVALLRTNEAKSRILFFHVINVAQKCIRWEATHLIYRTIRLRVSAGLQFHHAWKMLRNAFAWRFQSRVTGWTSAEYTQGLLIF